MTDASLASPDVVLTDRAARRIGRILGKEEPGTSLRISVAGGGCSGFQYRVQYLIRTRRMPTTSYSPRKARWF